MTRPRRKGPKTCAKCDTPIGVWRTYCAYHQAEYDHKRREARLALMDAEILNTPEFSGPPPSGFAIYQEA